MITDEEIESLPDDPELAFVQVEKILRSNLLKSLFEIPSSKSEDEYFDNQINARLLKQEYVRRTLAAAKAYKLDILDDWKIPSGERVDAVYESF